MVTGAGTPLGKFDPPFANWAPPLKGSIPPPSRQNNDANIPPKWAFLRFRGAVPLKTPCKAGPAGVGQTHSAFHAHGVPVRCNPLTVGYACG